jgi:hypothetical protein
MEALGGSDVLGGWRVLRRLGLGAACPGPRVVASDVTWQNSSRIG